MQSFYETVHCYDEWENSHQSVSHSVNFPGGGGGYYVYAIYVCSDLLCFEGLFRQFQLFYLNILLSFGQVHKKFEESLLLL